MVEWKSSQPLRGNKATASVHYLSSFEGRRSEPMVCAYGLFLLSQTQGAERAQPNHWASPQTCVCNDEMNQR